MADRKYMTAFGRSIPVAAMTAPLVMVALAGVTATMSGCDDRASADVAKIDVGGKNFFLELALTNDKRFRGLSERTFIEPDGGILFVFPDSQVMVQGFVMRDCPIPIDIIYLDSAGRVLAMHEMKAEPPRDPAKGEGTPADANNVAYNSRLKQWSSRYPSQFVIELAGGTLKTLSLKEGDQIRIDPEFKKRAR
jgi:uncharacterized membrane protein (UPF0127 family)